MYRKRAPSKNCVHLYGIPSTDWHFLNTCCFLFRNFQQRLVKWSERFQKKRFGGNHYVLVRVANCVNRWSARNWRKKWKTFDTTLNNHVFPFRKRFQRKKSPNIIFEFKALFTIIFLRSLSWRIIASERSVLSSFLDSENSSRNIRTPTDFWSRLKRSIIRG